MRIVIPDNHVSYAYEKVIQEFNTMLIERQKENIKCIYLSGSYARGDANDRSDIDLFCLFETVDNDVLCDVGYCARNTSIPYDVLEINAQCMSLTEFKSNAFESWGYGEYAVRELDSVLLYGTVPTVEKVDNIQEIYKKYLGDVIMSIRHYLCVDEPKDKLSCLKMQTYILKPLIFALRLERYCNMGKFPLAIGDLYHAYNDERKRLVEYFYDADILKRDMERDYKGVLNAIHTMVLSMCL